jgi:cytochrome c peroxidase
MHDGSLKTLDDVVMFYYRGISASGPDGLKPDISALGEQSFSEMVLLVEFLKSLSGKAPEVTRPQLP